MGGLQNCNKCVSTDHMPFSLSISQWLEASGWEVNVQINLSIFE